MNKTVEQMMELIKSGVVLGGAHSDQDKEAALLYYYKEGQYYLGNASNGGPATIDEALTKENLRLRLLAHFNSISEEECARDAKQIQALYERNSG